MSTEYRTQGAVSPWPIFELFLSVAKAEVIFQAKIQAKICLLNCHPGAEEDCREAGGAGSGVQGAAKHGREAPRRPGMGFLNILPLFHSTFQPNK